MLDWAAATCHRQTFLLSESKLSDVVTWLIRSLCLQVRQVSRGLEPSWRHEGTFGRVLGRERPRWAEQGVRGVLPVPLLHQGIDEEEHRRKQPLKRFDHLVIFLQKNVLDKRTILNNFFRRRRRRRLRTSSRRWKGARRLVLSRPPTPPATVGESAGASAGSFFFSRCQNLEEHTSQDCETLCTWRAVMGKLGFSLFFNSTVLQKKKRLKTRPSI